MTVTDKEAINLFEVELLGYLRGKLTELDKLFTINDIQHILYICSKPYHHEIWEAWGNSVVWLHYFTYVVSEGFYLKQEMKNKIYLDIEDEPL